MAEMKLSRAEKSEAFREINQKSDRIMHVALFAYFGFGLFLSLFYNTFFLALAVGGMCLIVYFVSRYLLPETNLYKYVLSSVFAIFSAQFIYQMHGLFEMHFFFFVGSALLITFRDWKLILPLLLLTVVHHASFAWLQYSGMKEIYFTQLDYMDLQSFIFHALLAAVIMGICAYWAFDLGRSTMSEASKNSILKKQLSNVKNNIAFAEDMSKGNFSSEYSLDESDELGKSLVMMQQNLKKSSEREMEDKFITVGITKVSDIIRQHGNDANALADEFVKGIVKYAGLNQGALFIHEDVEGDEHLKLAACYAYDRKKYLQLRVNLGEGLVGQCFLEKDEIYMTAVPSNYTKITSGLGEATPSCVLMVPVKTQDEVVGVIELASFKKLKAYEKQFIHKAAENIASAIISSRTTDKIKALLADSQQRAEEMRSQEEEMRQNMEELSATQEEMNRKAVETENRVNAIEESGIASIEFNLDGTIITANKHFLDLMGYSLPEIQEKHHRIFVDAELARSQEYADFWADLRAGIPRPGEYKRVTKTGKTVYIKGSYSVIRDQNGRAMRVMKLATDITPLKVQQEEVQAKITETENRMNAIEQSGIASIEFDLNGKILKANKHFLDLMEYELSDIVGQHHRIFVDGETGKSKEYEKFWGDLRNGIPRPGEYKRVTKNGSVVYIKGSYSILRDQSGKPTGILKLASDITALRKQQEEVKSKEIESQNRVNAIEESGIASIEFDLNGFILSANKHFLAIMGYSIDEIAGKHHRIFVDSQTNKSKEYADFWNDLYKGIPRPGEYKRVTKSGATVYIRGSYSIIRDSKGKPTSILKLATDITSQKKQQQDIEKMLMTLQAVESGMEHTMAAVDESMAVIEFNANGEVQNANENFLKILGYDLDDIKGKHHNLFVDANERDSEANRKFWKDLAQGKTLKGEFTRIDKLGRTKWIRGNYSPIVDKSGKVERVINIAYDISEYR